MQSKLASGRYSTMQELNDDFEQIVINCKLFNPPGTLPVAHAERLQQVWHSEVAKANRMSYQEKRSLQGMMNRLKMKPCALIFLEPVDPIALGIPNYHDVIPKDQARDFTYIKGKLDRDEYRDLWELKTDFDLMVSNCLVFNGIGTPAYDVGKAMEAEFNRDFEGVKAQVLRGSESEGGGSGSNGGSNKKRQSMSGPGGAPAGGQIKKIRLGL